MDKYLTVNQLNVLVSRLLGSTITNVQKFLKTDYKNNTYKVKNPGYTWMCKFICVWMIHNTGLRTQKSYCHGNINS